MRLETSGQRIYFRDASFAAKDELKRAGARWDPDSKAWWMGAAKRSAAEALVARLDSAARALEASLPPASGGMVEVSGNTYPVRDRLRALGGEWDGQVKVWRVPESRLPQATALVASAPPKDAYRPTKCRQCGARPGPRGWPRIYRSGICSDCYEDCQ